MSNPWVFNFQSYQRGQLLTGWVHCLHFIIKTGWYIYLSKHQTVLCKVRPSLGEKLVVPLGQLGPHGTLSFGICQMTSTGNWCPPNPLLLPEGKVVHDPMHLILCKGKFLFPSMECCPSLEPVNPINFLDISYIGENTAKWHKFCEMIVCQPNVSNSLMNNLNPRKLQSGWASYIGIGNCWTDLNVLFYEHLVYKRYHSGL